MGLLFKGTPRSNTLVLAPYESSKASKRHADRVCDGFNDEDDLNELIQALPTIGSSSGGSIKIMEGILRLSGPGVINRSPVAIKGQGPGITVLRVADGANCQALRIECPGSSLDNVLLDGFTVDGNKDNQVDQPGRDDLCGIFMPDEPTYWVRHLCLNRIETRFVRHGAGIRLYRAARVFLTDIYNRENGVLGAAFPCDGAFIGYSLNVLVNGYIARRNTDVGLAIDDVDWIKVVNAQAVDNTETGFTYAHGAWHGEFVNCYGRASKQGFKSGLYGGIVNCAFLLISNSEFTDNTQFGIRLEDIDHVRLGVIQYAANGVADLSKGPGTSDCEKVSTVAF